ncbi:MAG: signal peptidase I [Magnetovibrio sp.]|nr:signal peptidase I [Magnetovibrio sp.]
MDDNPLDVEDLLDTKPAKDEETLWDTVKTIFYAVAIAILVRTFAFEPFSIPSGSMIPTLLVGDYLFVSKSSYGYSKHSLPFSLPIVPGRVLYEMPERGDVAVFKLPTDRRTDYIKRIVGLPGDTIQVRGGILHINGVAVKRESLGAYVYQDTYGIFHNTMRYRETLPNGVSHEIIEEGDSYPQDNTQVYQVPKDHYFGMGDNRDNSQDSRYLMNVGYIPKENLVGRADVLFFSISGSFWKFWAWPWSLRFERFFDKIG